MTMTYDYEIAAESRTFTASALRANNASMSQWRFSPGPKHQQCQAISVTLQDAAPTGIAATSGQGPRWLGLAFRVSPLGPIYDNLAAGVKQ